MTALDGALAQLTDLVSFLRWRIDEPTDGEVTLADLLADDQRLQGLVADSRPAWDTDDTAVLASLWWQAYAYRMGGTTLACWLLAGVAPDPSLAGTGVGIARFRPSSIVVDPAAEAVGDLGQLVERLFAGHLDQVAAVLRRSHRIGEQLLWGNAGAGIASALLAVAGADGAPAGLRERAPAILDALPHDIGSLGTWRDGEHLRKTCCLWYKAPSSKGAYCADCPIPERT